MILSLALFTVACGSESSTTAPTTTQKPMETTPTSTKPIETSTLEKTTAPKTTPAPAWMAKLEENFYEKAVEENGEYYIYLTYKFESSRYAVKDNQTFVEAYVADEKDIVFANLEYGRISNGIYLRATAEEIEAYAKNSYVTGIYSYAQDKVVEGCKATRSNGGFVIYESFLKMAENINQRPLVKIDSKEELVSFIDTCIYDNSHVYEELEIPSFISSKEAFEKETAIYDEAFFAEKSLFMIYIQESTGSAHHSLVHVIADQGVTVVIDRSAPWGGTDDAPTWVMFVEVEKSAIANQTSFNVIMHSGGY